MVRSVFLLGRPGSGKSTVANEIRQFAEGKGWITHHIFDYRLLQNLFLVERGRSIPDHEKKFVPQGPEECNGFDVRDFSVLDTVLEKMAQEVSDIEQRNAENNELILIEFARANYTRALYLFGQAILRDAYLLYMDVDLKICIDRVLQRIECDCQQNLYNHFVSDDIMRGYYCKDDWPEVVFNLRHIWGLSMKTQVIDNIGNLYTLRNDIKRLAEAELLLETATV
jgi:adenylate kinase family enzyme